MLDDILKDRLKKLEKYKKTSDPYPAHVLREHGINYVLNSFDDLAKNEVQLLAAGRVRALRNQGGIIFIDVEDETGKIQIILDEKKTKEFDLLKEVLDIGDFVAIEGRATETKRGEKSILAQSAHIISKSLRPLPSAWYGLENKEIRLRKRYLDFLMNPETRKIFELKARFWQIIRNYLSENGFLEVDMPILESIPGGAEAEPFITHHNALDQDFYLRISLELPLKKMLVGGVERVCEIGRIFRNEGISTEHLQDYTQMECYAAYWDYNDMMEYTRGLYQEIVKGLWGNLETKSGEHKLDWSGNWDKVDYHKAFRKETDINLSKTTEEELKDKAIELGIDLEDFYSRGRLIDLIYKKTVRPKLIQPCFLVDPPIEVEPLAKRLDDDPSRVARFQIVAAGTELGKGFSELNDPIDQRKRFEDQMKLREQGDEEAQRIDEEFLEALEYGMPPAAGFGLSERLFAVLMNKPVRETVIFPIMKQLINDR